MLIMVRYKQIEKVNKKEDRQMDKTLSNLEKANKLLDAALARALQPPDTSFIDREKNFWKTMKEVPCNHIRASSRIDGLIKM